MALEADIFPDLGETPLTEISSNDTLTVLRKIETRGVATIARLATQRLSSVFDYAISTLRAQQNPILPIKGAVKSKKTRHHPHLSYSEISELILKIESYTGDISTKISMKLLLLTFVRTSELRLAEWDEFDVTGDIHCLSWPAWVIPQERMKQRRPHVVPLSAQTLSCLTDLRKISGDNRYLFPNLRRPGSCMTITTINRALERMGYKGSLSGHGFRGTASTALHEMGFQSDYIEAQLAHAQRGVRAAYNHASYLDERKTMMEEWARTLVKKGLT
jgi:integrase